MSKVEKRDITVNRITLKDVPLDGLTDGEISTIVTKIEEDITEFSIRKNLMSTADLFAYVALSYAMRLYQIEHLEKGKQKAEEKRLDETLKRLENFLKNP